jgi:hypothetical protein
MYGIHGTPDEIYEIYDKLAETYEICGIHGMVAADVEPCSDAAHDR